MNIVLIRHGETVTSGLTYAGRRDVPLNAHGRAQAQRLAKELASQTVSHILTSPLSRAIETAMPLAYEKGVNPVSDSNLMELDFGVFEGRSKTELGLKLRKTNARDPLPDGESLHDVWSRADEAIARIRAVPQEPNSVCAIVGHFWINRMLWARARNLTFEDACKSRAYRPKTGSCVSLILSEHAIE